MSVERALVLLTHLLALTGFATLVVAGKVDRIGIAVFLAALAVSYVGERSRRALRPGAGLLTAASVLLVLYVVAGVVMMGKSLLDGLITLLVYVQVIKLLGPKTLRDVGQIYLLSFFHFLAGSIATVDFGYAVVFVVYVSVAVCAVVVLNMMRESRGRAGDSRIVRPGFLSMAVGVSFAIFIGTSIVFVSVPRLSSGYVSGVFAGATELRTGFSDEVELGRVGEIKRDRSPVMRVKITNLPRADHPSPLYWRGVALDLFDGHSWRISPGGDALVRADDGGVLRVAEAGAGEVVEQYIVTEPLDSSVLFAASMPVAFVGTGINRVRVRNDSYFLSLGSGVRMEYKAYSVVRPPTAAELRKAATDYPPPIKRRYLQLPPMDGRVRDLALRITAADRTNYDRALSVRNYLRRNLSYTLRLDPGEEGFPLEDFLFRGRKGHCEYFATAMVVMLRTLGIPARIVNGFLGGEWNEFGNFYLVRASDAHSWVEAYFPPYGWVTFDPTPAVSEEGSSRGLPAVVGAYYDYLRYRWSRYVVDFTRRDQRTLLRRVESGLWWRMKGVEYGGRRLLAGGGVLVPALVAFAAVGAVWMVRRKGLLAAGPLARRRGVGSRAAALYAEAVGVLERRGFEKSPSETPGEFCARVAADGGANDVWRPVLVEITELYQRIRFGGAGSVGEEGVVDGKRRRELERLERLVEVLKRAPV